MKNFYLFAIFLLAASLDAATPDPNRRQFLVSTCHAALLLSLPNQRPSLFPSHNEIQWEIIGPKAKPLYRGSAKFDWGRSASDVSLQLFEKAKIPFVEGRGGILSALDTPTGQDAVERVGDNSFRVYGWCYEVDGAEPVVMPDRFHFQKEASVLRWFYGYCLYENGIWKAHCTPE